MSRARLYIRTVPLLEFAASFKVRRLRYLSEQNQFVELNDLCVIPEHRSDGISTIGTQFNAITTPFRFNEAQLFTRCTNFSFYNKSAVRYIKEITLPNSVTTIGGYWFQDATVLVKVVVPGSVTSMSGEGTFRRCPAMQSFICYAETPPTLKYTNSFSNNSCLIYVPDDSVNAYKTASNWSSYASRIRPLSEYTDG